MARRSGPQKRVEPTFDDAPPVKAERKPAVRRKKPSAKKKSRARKTRSRTRLLKPFLRLTYWGTILGLWGGIAAVAVIAFYAVQLPSMDTWTVPDRPPNMRIVADDGSVMTHRGVTGGEALRLEDMAPSIAQAVIAIEDRRFHAHFGFDPIGFTRAMVRNIAQKRMREGGSTITQQLAKNLFLKPERTFARKVQELILAVWLETKYSKSEILELYLNRVYFGAGATGVDAAARRYFGKSAKYVSVDEAALLAGLLKAPSRFSPAKNPQLAQSRARVVLRAMQEEGYIREGSLDIDKIAPGENARHFRSGPEHYVADRVARQASALLGEIRQDVTIETTISPFLMTVAQSLIDDTLEKHGKAKRVSQAALVSMQGDGAIKALIGGRNYGQSQFNRATDAKRQPGSAFKTFVWLKALESGAFPEDEIIDAPVRYGKWQPENYDKKYRGPVTLETAFAKSLNTVAAQLIMREGPKSVTRLAERMGIASPLKANASLSLGTSEVTLLELTRAYVPLANGGRAIEPYLIKRIVADDGTVLYQRKNQAGEPVISEQGLSGMNQMLAAVIARGTGRKALLAAHAAGGKTGTSQGFRDALFVGHTAHLTTGVWMGNDDNKPTKKLTGGGLPASVWHDFMETAHRDLQPKPLPGYSGGALAAFAPETLPVPTRRPSLGRDGATDNGARQLVRRLFHRDEQAPRPPVNSTRRPPADVGTDTTGSVEPTLRDRVGQIIRNRANQTIKNLIGND